MTKEEIAAKLNGREYRQEITPDIKAAAKEAGLVIVFGASDDLMEFDGAIYDEVGCYDGGSATVTPNGILDDYENIDKDDKDAMRKYFTNEGKGREIEAVWCGEEGYSWTYKTDIPHATFDIMEDGEKYCRGIVFALADCA